MENTKDARPSDSSRESGDRRRGALRPFLVFCFLRRAVVVFINHIGAVSSHCERPGTAAGDDRDRGQGTGSNSADGEPWAVSE